MMTHTDPKFENPKCWSYVFVGAPQAGAVSASMWGEGGGGGKVWGMLPQKFLKIRVCNEFLPYQTELNEELKGLFFG